MILKTAIDIFVERIENESALRAVPGAGRLIVIDCCAPGLRVAAMLGRLRSLEAPEPLLITRAELDQELEVDRHDVVWILVDRPSELPYCELLRDDLASRVSSAALIAVGEFDGGQFAAQLTRAQLGGGSIFLRRRDLARGAQLAAELFGLGGAGR